MAYVSWGFPGVVLSLKTTVTDCGSTSPLSTTIGALAQNLRNEGRMRDSATEDDRGQISFLAHTIEKRTSTRPLKTNRYQHSVYRYLHPSPKGFWFWGFRIIGELFSMAHKERTRSWILLFQQFHRPPRFEPRRNSCRMSHPHLMGQVQRRTSSKTRSG